MSRHRVVVLIHACEPGGSDITGYLDVDAADTQAAEAYVHAQMCALFWPHVTVQAVSQGEVM